MAEVEVTRRSACGHDCAKCGGCGGLETQTLYVTAFNGVAAQVGDRVLLEGETGRVLGIAVLVYLLPVVLFFIGYGAGSVLGGRNLRRTPVRTGYTRRDVVQPPNEEKERRTVRNHPAALNKL